MIVSERRDSLDTGVYPELCENDIEMGEQLGVGSYGSVFKGIWSQTNSSKKIVALKKVFMLEKEAEILSKIRHRNIIEFYGICRRAADFFIVTEYAQNGSLYDILHKDTNNEIEFKQIRQWAKEIACGIYYLHNDAVVTIIHRDLKSKNVVVDASMKCKICDFGTSKDLTHSCTAPTWGGTAAWMSPEIINQNDSLTTAADVWSYGVVLWEMLSRQVPYKDFSEFRIYSLISQEGMTLAIPASCPAPLERLMAGCWRMKPRDRLSISEILKELRGMESSPAIEKECVRFLSKKDEEWKKEIEKQKAQVENMKRRLERQKERLDQREKEFIRHVNEQTIYAHMNPPEDVNSWNEHHSTLWIGKMLSRTIRDHSHQEKINLNVIRHRITGSRLLDLSQKDLEHLGVNKLGSRLELMKHIKQLKEEHNNLTNFPTLEHSRQLHLQVKTERHQSPASINPLAKILLLLGMNRRSTDSGCRFKFHMDFDWADDQVSISSTQPPHSLIKSVCFSVFDIDNNNRPVNDPACYPSSSCVTSEWIAKTEEINNVKVIANVHYSDIVTEPRSTEMVAVIQHFIKPMSILDKTVQLRLRKRSSSTVTTPSSIKTSPSTPQLRGVWQKKAMEYKHALTEVEIMEINGKLHSSSSSERDSPQNTVRENKAKQNHQNAVNGTDQHPMKIHGGKPKWAWKSQQRRNL